jgi:PAS domain S-box-containing protein
VAATIIAQTEKPHVLIVDDEQRNLDALEVMLSALDCNLVRATTADAALLALLKYDFAAIVLDIRMPGMNGIELAKLIKQRKRSQHIPILFLTAHSVDDNDVLQGYGAGAVDYLSKPINAEILRSKIGVFVDVFTKTRALAQLNETLQQLNNTLRKEVSEREKAQAALQLANEELERRVQERTAALVRAHKGVEDNEERLRMALAVARVAAWEWDLLSGRMTWSTDPEALFGFEPGSLGSELRLVRAAHADDRPLIENAVARALQNGTYDAEYRLVRRDGAIAWITERGRIVRDDETSQRMVGISRDVTAEKELLSSARAARDEALRQSRLKDEFLASLSHELRTPMNVILGWLSTLEEGKPIRDVYSALAVVKRNAELQAKLIEDLLDMNRFISGTIQLERDRVDIAGLLRTTIQGLQPAADGKGVQVIASVDSGLDVVLADSRRIQQVLWNLVHNSVKFTPRGGRVEIHVHQGADCLEITVQDNGRGIGPAFLPHIFERFRQEDGSPTAGSSGLGLGLAITKQIVELHGGTIEGWSDGVGKGATFVVQLPTAASTGEGQARSGSFPASA